MPDPTPTEEVAGHLGEGQVGRLGESAWSINSVPKSPSPLWIQGLKPLPLLLTPITLTL